jgi:hypothetical protein
MCTRGGKTHNSLNYVHGDLPVQNMKLLVLLLLLSIAQWYLIQTFAVAL